MDDFHARALKSLRERHESQIRQAAEAIQEHVGYVLARLDRDASGSTIGHWVGNIATDGQEIITRLAILESMGEAVAILETSDEPAKGAAK